MKRALCSLGWVVVITGCALRHEDAKPKEIAVDVAFPSTDDALRMDVVQVSVYGDDVTCLDVLDAIRTNDPSGPAPVATTSYVGICTFVAGGVKLAVPLGTHAFLAQAARGDANVVFFTGCTDQTLGEGDAVAPISLSRSDDLSRDLESTSCQNFGQLCAKPAQCK